MEIACIGNELLIGKIVNTNAAWLSKRATSMGIAVKRITVGPDDIVVMANIFREILARKPKFLIITGGLGPTFDDKTLAGIAEALNYRLAINEVALKMVKEKYMKYLNRRGIPEGEMTPARVKMATLPECAKPLPNPIGSAPGVLVDWESTLLFSLPGVPKEMEAIFNESVAPMLRQASGDLQFYELSIFTDAIMESALAPLIDRVMQDFPRVYIKSHPNCRKNQPHMELHLSSSGKPSENLQELLAKASVQLAGLIETAGGKVIKAESQTMV